ncbi:uncharacterized protein LY89DRAFT_757949 [Mollisia scopiformis]|uniref:Uncharacterized protein n=1 Tax=Mollisia scopiformis TaxID=149040 RepID=A0A194WX99_MOLSC|nr:uncharacterized protein LY89DRAFT_757949 [Mollisia scopiformis]KUJ12217.1 hypothetical protein LY89DRAFT_757949 [Mollisia scopiformis]
MSSRLMKSIIFVWVAVCGTSFAYLDARDPACSVTLTENIYSSTVTEYLSVATLYATMNPSTSTVYETVSGSGCPLPSRSCTATVTQTNMTTITETLFATSSTVFSSWATLNVTIYTTVSGSECSLPAVNSTPSPSLSAESASAIKTTSTDASTSSASTLTSKSCASTPTLINSGFESGALAPWAQISNFDDGAGPPSVVFSTHNPLNGSYYLSQTLNDGTDAMIYQDVPAKEHAISNFAKQRTQTRGVVPRTQESARIEAYIECLGTGAGSLNTVLIDTITID